MLPADFRRVLSLPVPWKSLVTQFQIVQFGTSGLLGMVTLTLLLGYGEKCAGPRFLLFNFAFNMTLLYQFVGVLSGGRSKNRRE